MKKNYTEYFLGANSTQGFFSCYGDFTDPIAGDKLYIIKGGPGGGKSGFMKKIARRAQEAGFFTEYIYCSGDPDSLDGVYFPEKKSAIVDGTSPHVTEPSHHGVTGFYVDLGQFCHYDGNAGEIIRLFSQYKSHYIPAYEYLKRYGQIHAAALPDTEKYDEKLMKKAASLVKKLGLPTEKPVSKSRLVSAFTYKGYINLASEIEKYSTIIALSGTGNLPEKMCRFISLAAENRNISTVLYLDPLFPESISSVALPDTSVIFVSCSALKELKLNISRKVYLDSVIDKAEQKTVKKLLKLSEKPENALLGLAQGELIMAKSAHDELEKTYNPYIDFDGVSNLADKYYDIIFK